jgi:thioester reductase-like protein
MKKEIAIIGISIKVSHATNLEEFWQLIEKNEPAFYPLSDLREKDVFDRFGRFEIAAGSYLDRVDLFDNDYFKIAPAEAERMDPEQRLMMEYALKAVHNAGYVTSELKGQPIGIFHTFGDSRYKQFFDDSSNLSLTSHMPGMVGTRVANFMDWRGPVIGFDTTCSSSSSALYCACQSLANGDCSMALVGGVHLGVFSEEMIRSSPILSKKGHCRPYDTDADGTLSGEGVICVLLKPVEDAIRDSDPIHAVIKGGAVNHGGALIQNISAPSPVAQSEVIRKAWENSGVSPSQVRFIETHGTGTVLGDPIEFRGLVSAFENLVSEGEKACSVSSVKGQLGHLGSIAGLAGLIRLVLALKNKQLLPQPGFREINPHIKEEPFVKVQRHLEFWESDGLRVGGVSSFGLTGTNVHMMAEEFKAPVFSPSSTEKGRTYYMKVGGASESRALRIKEYLKQYIQTHPAVSLDQLCYSVNKVTEEDQFGQVIRFRDHKELEKALDELSFSKPRQKTEDHKIFLMIPGILDWEDLKGLLNQSPALSALYEVEVENLGRSAGEISNAQKSLLLHYCATRLMIQSGFSPEKIIGAGSGKILSLSLASKLTMKEAMAQAEANSQEPFNSSGFIQFLDSLSPEKNYLLAVMGSQGEMIQILKQWLEKNAHGNIRLVFPENVSETCQELLAVCYSMGNSIHFEKLCKKEVFLHDLHLPVLEPKRFWPVVTRASSPAEEKKEDTEKKKMKSQNMTHDEIIEGVQAIWREKLKIAEVGDHDDFFDLGGSSLMGLDVLQLIEKRFAVSLQYADIFDYCTVSSQTSLIEEMLAKAQLPSGDKDIKDETPAAPPTEDYQRQLQYEELIQEVRKQDPVRITLRHVLVTGGTGFLGAYIIKELLTQTSAFISCLTRGETEEASSERLVQSLRSCFPEEELDYSRITAVKGDITLPGLGLTAEAQKFISRVDAVYHLAANVSHYGKAESINGVNFEGTVNLLEWTKRFMIPRFNHFSTNAVITGSNIDNKETASFYETDLDLGQNFGRNLYPLSKFKAEQYIQKNKGDVKVNVFRIGHISGHSETGLFQKNIESNNFYQRLKTLAGLGCYCDEITGQSFATTPVDVVSRIAVSLSLHENDVLETFHIIDSSPIQLDRMVELLADHHIELRKIDKDRFLTHVEKLSAGSDLSTENPFLGIMRYGSGEGPRTRFNIHQEATKACLDRMGIPYTYDKEEYAHTIIRYCIEKGFIKQPVKEVFMDY